MGQEQVLGTGAAAPVRRSAPWWKWALSVGLAAGLIALLAFGFTRSPKEIPSPLIRQPPPPSPLRFPPDPETHPPPPHPSARPRLHSGAPGRRPSHAWRAAWEGRGAELLGLLVLPRLLERGPAPPGRLGAFPRAR